MTSSDVVTLQAGADFHRAPIPPPLTTPNLQLESDPSMSKEVKYKPNLGKESLHIKRFAGFVIYTVRSLGVCGLVSASPNEAGKTILWIGLNLPRCVQLQGIWDLIFSVLPSWIITLLRQRGLPHNSV